jgi:nucleoside-diphosphate-sugar epimerase
MKNIFLTGANGFVGKNVKQSHFFVGSSFRNFDRINIDLSCINAVFHFAAIAHDFEGVYSKEDYLEVNVELTKRIYDKFLDSEASLFVYLSSVKAIADNCTGLLDENTFPDPQTFYGKSKLLAEDYIISKSIPKGKRFIILRPSLIYGKQNKGNLILLEKLIRYTRLWPLNAFKNARSFCYIENLSFALNEFLQCESIKSGVYNICDDGFMSTNDLVYCFAKINNIHFLKINIPTRLVKLIASFGSIFNLPFNKIVLDKLTQNYKVDNSKLLKALGKPLPYSSQEGFNFAFNKLD